MRRMIFASLAMLLAFLLAASATLAANPHFVVGPTFTLNPNGSVTATGSVAGLGNQNIDVVLTAHVDIDIDCRNPGGNIAPGQRQQATISGSQTNLHVENGRANFNVTTAAPALNPSLTPRQLGCPNNKWTPEIRSVSVRSATLQVYQPSGGGNLVLSRSVTF